jgi:adenosylcobinamide kinase/adenosylcobinamide-phosphate guanylyltransferase
MTGKRSDSSRDTGSLVTLILGGARSGKSRMAVDLARRSDGPVAFLAAGRAGDAEMAARIERHRRERPAEWRTIEQARDLGAEIAVLDPGSTVLLDGLGDVATDYLLAQATPEGDLTPSELTAVEADVEAEITGLVGAARAAGLHLIVVSNEVGLGLVPPYPLGRHYRDVLGRANQRLAAAADRVYLMIAGLPIRLKPSPESEALAALI